MIITYHTDLPIADCMRNIMEFPHTYKCKWGTTLNYKVEEDGTSRAFITFCGGQFRKIMRTTYRAEFLAEEGYVRICLHFLHEFLGLPPLTPISDIDLFMQQKASAHRVAVDPLTK